MTVILVTGSRLWRDVDYVRRTLRYHRGAYPGATLRHGDAAGLDRIARSIWVGEWLLPDDAWPVTDLDRRTGGNQAPLLRNSHMVNLGATIGLVFWRGEPSNGTTDCYRKMVAAGIPVYEHHHP